MPNLNYPNYGQPMGGYGSYQPQAPALSAPPPAPGPSGLDYASFGMNLLGGLGNAYGTYLQSQQAEKQNEQAMQAYQEQMARQQEMDKQNQQQQQTNNTLNAGQYAQGLEKDVYGTYSPWARSAGI